jgi:hypothetical protein
VLPCVPKTLTSGNAKRGLFTGQDFIYDAEKDHDSCAAGEHLTKGLVRSDRRGDIDPPSDRLLHLSSQAQMYAGQVKANQALEARTCPRRRTQKRVRTEMSLHVLAYNMKRVIAIIGVGPLLQAIRT